MSTQGQVMKYARNVRRRKGVPDLNDPPLENLEQTSGPTPSSDQGGQPHPPAGSTQPAPIDVEEFDDDDVIISSSIAFEEAKKKSRRRSLVIDVDAEEVAIRLGPNQANKRRRSHPNPPTINCELYVNLEDNSSSMRERAPQPPPPPPKEPTFTCPVCICPLVEEVTTKCGHIFCKACITSAIKAQHKCPTCRQKLTNRNLIRVYLPTTK